jgi:hypothetical protein
VKRHYTVVVEDINRATSLGELALIESEEGGLSPKAAVALVAKAKDLRTHATASDLADARGSMIEGSALVTVLDAPETSALPAEVDAASGVDIIQAFPAIDDGSAPEGAPKVASVRSRRLVGRLVRVRGPDGRMAVTGRSTIRRK